MTLRVIWITFIGTRLNMASSIAQQIGLDWPYSTFHRFVRAGVYSADWGIAQKEIEGKPFGE
jgi:uncharacterized membrane protein